MASFELVESWVNANAPDEIKNGLISGYAMFLLNRAKKRREDDTFPKTGIEYSSDDIAYLWSIAEKVLELNVYSDGRIGTSSLWPSNELRYEAMKRLGRKWPSIKSRIRYMMIKKYRDENR